MTLIALTVLPTEDGRLKVRCEASGRLFSGEASLPSTEGVEELTAQLRAGDAPPVVGERLADILGDCLFAGEAGLALREQLEQDPQATILLATGEAIADWPWELARDPDGGPWPVRDGADMVRLAGEGAQATTGLGRAVLVVPGESAQSRISALQAATRRLSRKRAVDVYPAAPVTGRHLRTMLAHGALFVHVEARALDGKLQLDDGPVPPDRLGVGDHTWLVTLAGTDPAPAAARRMRRLGVPLVLGLQATLPPNAAAAFDRELYRALGAGEPVARAARRIRDALGRLHPDSFDWAIPVLWSAPSTPGGIPAACLPFPPPESGAPRRRNGDRVPSGPGIDATITDQPALSAVPTLTTEMPALPPRDPDAAPGFPVPAADFVRETVDLLRSGGAETRELTSRVATLRSLGDRAGAVLSPRAEEKALAPAERTARIAERLIDAVGRPDLALARGPDHDGRVVDVARTAAIDVRSAHQAATALLAARAVALVGPDAGVLARLLAEEVFAAHPRHVQGDGGDPIVTAGRDAIPGFHGWAFETIAQNWRADEVRPFQPTRPAPTTRMRVVVPRAAGGYDVREGAWLVVEAADRTPPTELARILHAVSARVLEGLAADGRPYRLVIPADFRVVLAADSVPANLPVGVPVVEVHPTRDADVERSRWTGALGGRLGPAADAGEALRRQQAVEAVHDAVRLIRLVAPVPGELGLAAAIWAALGGGKLQEAVDEALCVHLAPWIASRTGGVARTGIPMVVAALAGDSDGCLNHARSLAQGADPAGAEAVRALAALLDIARPNEQSRVDAFDDARAKGGKRMGPLVDGWKKTPPPAPMATCPELRRRLLALV